MRRLAWLMAVLMPVALLAAAPTAAERPARAYSVPVGPTFNVPKPWGSDAESARIVLRVEQAFRNIRPSRRDRHPVLVVATYLFDRIPSTDALIGACQRGVSVRVIINDDVNTATFRRLVTVLNADNVPDRDNDGQADRGPDTGPCNRPLNGGHGTNRRRPLMTYREARQSIRAPLESAVTWGRDGSYVKQCSGSCRGLDRGNMHSKFYAFSSTGRSDHVTMVSSTNLNAGGVLTGWNDLFVVKDRPDTFRFMVRMHRLMTEERRAGRRLVELRDGPFTTRFFPMMRAGRANDPVMNDLRRVRCSSAFGRTTLDIEMFWWDGRRGNWIADKILELARQGCRIRIIIGAIGELRHRLVPAARSGLIELWDSRLDTDGNGMVNTRTHLKSVAIRGTYAGNRRYHGVWTGTANWVGGSLAIGDENTLNIASRGAWSRYVAHWNQVRNHSRRMG